MLFRRTLLNTSDCERLCLVFILLTGFSIRLYQIGHDSFWNDEAGVVLVALAPSVQETIKMVRSHVMAMPLDYLLTRFMTRVSLQEPILRLPSAIFGTLTVAVCYNLFQLVIDRRVALLGALMLSLSPLHVMYSQEIRFYSSLLFFYYLSSYLLLSAVANYEKRKKWPLFWLACVIGSYFHIFVLFSVINGFAWALFRLGRKGFKTSLPCLLGSAFSTFICVLPGYLYFGSHQKFHYPLLLWGGSFVKEIALGLGWYELPFVSRLNVGLAWYLICLGLFLSGLVAAIQQSSKGLIALVVSSIVQIFLIISADLVKGYWFAYRQLLFLHPIMLILSSYGYCTSLNIIQRVIKTNKKVLGLIFVGLLLLINFFSLHNYFRWSKSEARQISEHILTDWLSLESEILIAPGYQEKVYSFYFQYIFRRPDVVIQIRPIEMDELLREKPTKRTFLIVVDSLSEQTVSQLLQRGFSPIKTSHAWLGHSLFIYIP